MSNLRSICRPHTVFSCCRSFVKVRVSVGKNPNLPSTPSVSVFISPSLSLGVDSSLKKEPWLGRWSSNQHRRMVAKASSNWTDSKTPYQILELEGDEDEEQIKVAYRRLAKYYHPDVYDGRGTLEEGETAETRFIKIQAAYELLIDKDRRRQYDVDNRVNPLKASQAWMEWIIKKRKAFDQRGDMAIAAWAEQQQRELNLRARRLARSKIDPEEERKILVKERKASMENFNTLRRHTLVLKKRDLMRKKAAEEEKRKNISRLLAAEGLELAEDEDNEL
ncbi:hypothetical protein M9H77_31961 [Catharanthus roseus]|uniref:Uncharacterized protein n=1 Tax=Catharanthus roseus TaxID=4058 RepID=A0ACC0A1Y4_CATRO|nr:hypothetical protein M9H77_31961 [Catharanthus roseus]